MKEATLAKLALDKTLNWTVKCNVAKVINNLTVGDSKPIKKYSLTVKELLNDKNHSR